MNTASDMLKYTVEKLEEEETSNSLDRKTLDLFLKTNPNRTDVEAELRSVVRLHDELLVKNIKKLLWEMVFNDFKNQIRRGPRGRHRCHEEALIPENQKRLKKQRKQRKKEEKRAKEKGKAIQQDRHIRESDEALVSMSREQEVEEVNEKTQRQYQMLCSGESIRVSLK